MTGEVKMIQKTSSLQGGVVRLPLLHQHMPQLGRFPVVLYVQDEHTMTVMTCSGSDARFLVLWSFTHAFLCFP